MGERDREAERGTERGVRECRKNYKGEKVYFAKIRCRNIYKVAKAPQNVSKQDDTAAKQGQGEGEGQGRSRPGRGVVTSRRFGPAQSKKKGRRITRRRRRWQRPKKKQKKKKREKKKETKTKLRLRPSLTPLEVGGVAS